MFRRLRLEGPIPQLKAFNNAAATGVPVSDVKGSPAIRTRKAYYAAGKELLTYAGET
jgi:cellulose biosynthesis protein BcsQ